MNSKSCTNWIPAPTRRNRKEICRKTLLVLLALMTLWTAIPGLETAVFADDQPMSGKCGDNVTWTLTKIESDDPESEYYWNNEPDKYTLTISGSGPMEDYDYVNTCLKENA